LAKERRDHLIRSERQVTLTGSNALPCSSSGGGVALLLILIVQSKRRIVGRKFVSIVASFDSWISQLPK
jgi:hypothetical protein